MLSAAEAKDATLSAYDVITRKIDGSVPNSGGSSCWGICIKPIIQEKACPAPTRIKTTPVITPVCKNESTIRFHVRLR